MNVLLLYNTYSISSRIDLIWQPPPHHNHFYGPFSGTTRVSRCQKRTSDVMVQGKSDRGRHTNHPAGRHSIRTNQCPPPPSPHFYRPDALPAAQPTVSKHWRQLAYSDNGEDARVLLNGVTCTMSDSVWKIDSSRFFPSLVRALKWGTHRNCPVVRENHLQAFRHQS